MVKEVLHGTPHDQSLMLMIIDMIGILAAEVETVESPVVEEEEEGSSSRPGNSAKEGEDTDGEEHAKASPEKQNEH